MRGKGDLLILNFTEEICALVNLLIIKNYVNYIRSLLSKAVRVLTVQIPIWESTHLHKAVQASAV